MRARGGAALLVAISGCSGGGKSALLAELARRGYATVAEPGRRVVADERASGGGALPWADAAAFARRIVAMSRGDLAAASRLAGPVFFDRGLVDAAVALDHATNVGLAATLDGQRRYDLVLMAPPWPELFAADRDRRHGYAAACEEYERLSTAWPTLGYEPVELPKLDIGARADFVEARLETTR